VAHRWPAGPAALPILQGGPDGPCRRQRLQRLEPLHLLPRTLRLLPLEEDRPMMYSYSAMFFIRFVLTTPCVRVCACISKDAVYMLFEEEKHVGSVDRDYQMNNRDLFFCFSKTHYTKVDI